MKITGSSHHCRSAVPRTTTAGPAAPTPTSRYNTLVEVRSDEGLTGIGSCFTTRPLVEASLDAARAAAHRRDRRWSPSGSARSCGNRCSGSAAAGRVEHTISGLDIALWDLMGKALGQPVSRLLGGNYRDRIKPYASILFDDPPRLAEKLLRASRARLSRHQDGLAAVRPREPQARRAADHARPATRWATTSS